MDQSFPPTARLHDGRDYGRVFNVQRKAAGRHLVLLLRPRGGRPGTMPARLGVVVSVKISPDAVRRHQLKRWVRELFRTRLKETLAGNDVVVLFRRDPPADGHAGLDSEILSLIPKALAAQPDPGARRPPRARA